MNGVAIVLLVKHLTAGGMWISAPPAEMGTMWECKKAKIEVEEGFRVDAIPDENFEVRCKQVRGMESSTVTEGNTKPNTPTHTVLD